jgi:hypothetical protein
MTAQKFSGICRGGPFDGQRLEHDRVEYQAAALPPLRLKFPPPALELNPHVSLIPGTYRFVLGQWIWRKDANHKNLPVP